MSKIKTTGAEWKAFMDSPWPDGKTMTDEEIEVDGVPVDELEFEYENLSGGEKVVITGGWVEDSDGSIRSLSAEFCAWRKRRSMVTMVVTIKKDKAEEVRSAVIAAGGSIT